MTTAPVAIPGLIKLTIFYHSFGFIAFIMLQMQYFISPYMSMYLWSGVVKMVASTVDTDFRN